YADTLGEAAALLKVDRQVLKDDAKQNIRGAAALLAEKAGTNGPKFKKVEEWFPAVKYLSGLGDDELQEMQATNYYNVLKEGANSLSFFGHHINIAAEPEVNVTSYL